VESTVEEVAVEEQVAEAEAAVEEIALVAEAEPAA
jgi:hypothetical protein